MNTHADLARPELPPVAIEEVLYPITVPNAAAAGRTIFGEVFSAR